MEAGGGGGGVPEASHFLIAVCFALGFLAARFLLDRLFFKRLAAILLEHGAAKVMTSDARDSKIVKCSESMWKLTYYVSVQLWVISIIQQEPWSLKTKEYFKGWPNQEMNFSLKLFYMCQCGFYIYSIAALVSWETRRKDFSIMMSHHIITSVLIGYSFITRFFRIGTIILALHDTSDVFMEAAKVFKYSENEMGASVGFGLFAISWLILRLIFFPFWIIKTSSYESIESLMVLECFPKALYYVFNTMLFTLLLFHIYWWKLIFAMIMRQMSNKGKVGEDIRSDSEDED
ncbi:ASC1-like protein 3 [Asparagus officinalis]|uniref:ASC1-like protein 3 n=1 Tax=Asparagus officinalis TaxID=4686 RepID=UPI00098E3776|nr:ASC1-like protein 3 [Asparagus officinalis]